MSKKRQLQLMKICTLDIIGKHALRPIYLPARNTPFLSQWMRTRYAHSSMLNILTQNSLQKYYMYFL